MWSEKCRQDRAGGGYTSESRGHVVEVRLVAEVNDEILVSSGIQERRMEVGEIRELLQVPESSGISGQNILTLFLWTQCGIPCNLTAMAVLSMTL